ncbi:hypothetical protein TNCV_3806651 [Trichonephila clavipes]|nr:hypothetical protein TNCV_3806651 [Trichonephila clavipes]
MVKRRGRRPSQASPSPSFHTTPTKRVRASSDLTCIATLPYTEGLQRYSRAFGDGPRNFDHGQVTRTTLEQAFPSPSFHTTPMGGRLSSRQI